MPTISIIIANYNYGRFLESAIQSVISQDGWDKCELIIVDGGSKDNSISVIRKYANYISWWVSESDNGQSDAFNKGFNRACGKFLVWLNADDIFTRGAIRTILNEINSHPDCEWFIGSTVYTDEKLRITDCFCAHSFSTLRVRFGDMSVGGPSSFFSKRLWGEAGKIDESLHYKMDTDLWYRFYYRCGKKWRRTRKNIFAFRKHESSKMSGADYYSTALALENRRKANAESTILCQRYRIKPAIMRVFIRVLTFSAVDYFIRLVRNVKWTGRYATEI